MDMEDDILITKRVMMTITVFLFFGSLLLMGGFQESNLVEAANPGLHGKYSNICSNSYKNAWGFGQGTSGVSCDEAYYLAFLSADFACKASLPNQSCPNANFCSPTGLPTLTGLDYGPCAATNLPGEPPKYTAYMYSFCKQKCG